VSTPDPDRGVQVRAAGGVVWRRTAAGEVEVLVVHRPRYDDWSLPKGKCDRGESYRDAAVREVAEETGAVCRLGPELPDVRYLDHKGRTKRSRYWAMEHRRGDFEPNDEVDEVRWLPLPAAMALLSYPHDRPVVAALSDVLSPS
jgi:8-oxo-dGTP pyrophosphatase MutT (NUDIX family)